MRIVCISDTHNQHSGIRVPDGDLLIHAGDGTGSGDFREVAAWLTWMDALPHPHKILVAGNHDWLFQREPFLAQALLDDHPGITYLRDSKCVVDGFRIWGSPWQPMFMFWAFNLPRGPMLREKWNQIPFDTDILVTHGPPCGILDQVVPEPLGGWAPDQDPPAHLGCEELLIRARTLRPRLHVFGHIHGGYGVHKDRHTTYVNACICDEAYLPVNAPQVLDLRKPRR